MKSEEPFHIWLLWAPYLLLLLVATPWYWQFLPEPLAVRTVMGMPLWAMVSVLASLAVSIYTAVLLMKRWPAELAEQEQPQRKEDA